MAAAAARLTAALHHLKMGSGNSSASTARHPCADLLDAGYIIDSETLAEGTPRTHTFTALCAAPRSGRLFAVCRRGVDKSASTANTQIAESLDGGNSWTVVRKYGFPNVYNAATGVFDASDARRGTWTYGMDGRTGDGRSGATVGEIRGTVMAELNDGSLLAVFAWLDAGRAVQQPDGRMDVPTRLVACRSRDHARSFSGFTELDTGYNCAVLSCVVPLPDGRVLLLLEVQEVGEDNTEIQRELAMVSDTNGVFGGPQTVITAAEGLQPGANQQKIYWDHRCVRLAEARPHHSLGFGGLYEY